MQRNSAACIAVGVAISTGLFAAVRAENPEHVKQLRETRKCVSCDLREAKLDGVNVELGDLTNSDLRLASLYRANLRGADLTGALLTGANLNGADLTHTKGADLLGAETDERTMCPGGTNGPCK